MPLKQMHSLMKSGHTWPTHLNFSKFVYLLKIHSWATLGGPMAPLTMSHGLELPAVGANQLAKEHGTRSQKYSAWLIARHVHHETLSHAPWLATPSCEGPGGG
jgi:hypothetical protein